MIRHASPAFRDCCRLLPEIVRAQADKAFAKLKSDLRQRAAHFKGVGRLFSARVGPGFRAPGVEVDDGILRFRIGSHADHDKLVS